MEDGLAIFPANQRLHPYFFSSPEGVLFQDVDQYIWFLRHFDGRVLVESTPNPSLPIKAFTGRNLVERPCCPELTTSMPAAVLRSHHFSRYHALENKCPLDCMFCGKTFLTEDERELSLHIQRCHTASYPTADEVEITGSPRVDDIGTGTFFVNLNGKKL